VADDVEVFRRVAHDVKVVLVAMQAFDDFLPVGDLQFDVDVRVAPLEVTQRARQKMLGGRHQRNPQLAALESLEVVDGRLEAVPDIIQFAYRGQHFLACCGQRDFPAVLFE